MEDIKKSLELIKTLHEKLDKKELLKKTPLKFLHLYEDKRDIEVVGFISAIFSYGGIKEIFKTIETILSYLGEKPFRFLLEKRAFKEFPPLSHRFNSKEDIISVLEMMGKVIRTFGSFENLFLFYYKRGEKIKEPLNCFANVIYLMLPKRNTSLKFLFPFPSEGSGCRRWNLFLKWMVRDDGMDRGIWKRISPADLVIPLNLHIWKVSKKLGLTNRKFPDWQAAEEVTEKLKLLNPKDPLSYEFTLNNLHLST